VLAGWEIPDEGQVTSDGAVDPKDAMWDEVALVPQSLGLSEELTVRENVMLPLRLSTKPSDPAIVDELMDRLDLTDLADRYPLETSLGEQQRTAVARALVLKPRLILADEPSSHQDDARGDIVFQLLGEAAAQGAGCVVATHDPAITRLVDRVVHMRDGRVDKEVEGKAERGEQAIWGRPSTA
jgi:putative ABC transport system ATP-binding protein